MLNRARTACKHSAFCLAGGLLLALACALAACGGDDDDSSPWAPVRGNGSAPETTGAKSSPGDAGSAGSGSDAGARGGAAVDTSIVPELASGFAADRMLQSLSDAELATLCERTSVYFQEQAPRDKYEQSLCFQMSDAIDAASASECRNAVDDCLVSIVFDFASCSLDALKGDDDCAATVQEYEACMREQAAVTAAGIDYYGCDTFDPDHPPQQLTGIAYACSALYSACPELY